MLNQTSIAELANIYIHPCQILDIMEQKSLSQWSAEFYPFAQSIQ